MRKTYLILSLLINSVFTQDIAFMNIYNDYADIGFDSCLQGIQFSISNDYEFTIELEDYFVTGYQYNSDSNLTYVVIVSESCISGLFSYTGYVDVVNPIGATYMGEQVDVEVVYHENVLGDINEDGSINVVDIVNLVNWIFDDLPYSIVADINEDGNINVVDVVVLVNSILGTG